MIKTENHCCDCAAPGYPCRGSACPNTHVAVYYCDECDPDCERPLYDVFEADGKHLCEDCLKNKFRLEDINFD